MRDFYFLKVFYSLVKSETAKRPGYYTNNKGFLEFCQAKTTKQNKKYT